MIIINEKQNGDKWLDWAKRIQAITQAGLTFTKDIYDRERYEELRNISAEIIQQHTGVEMKEINDLFKNERGYQTPKVDVRGVVFKDRTILLVREALDNNWALPGGFCEVGLSPAENILKEVKEEAGYDVIPIKLLALLDKKKHPHPPELYHYYKVFIQCNIVGGKATSGTETREVQFFSQNDLPNLSIQRNTLSQINTLFEFIENPNKSTIFD